MNILIINHYAGSISHGMEYRPYYLAKEWRELGHSVLIVAASHSHIRTQQPTMNQKFITDQKINGINYKWYPTPKYLGNTFGRVKNILVFLRGIHSDSHNLINSFKPDVVIASSTYPMDIWSAKKIARGANAKLIYEVHDLWPLSPIELGGMPRFHPFIIWCQLAENYAYKHADKVISMLPKTKPHMEAHGMKPNKFSYIPNGINLDEWKSIKALPQNIAIKLVNIKQRKRPIIGYTGTIGLANALDILLDVAKQGSDIFEVILVGTGPNHNYLLERIKNENIKNVTMLPAIPKASIPAFLKEVDIAYIGWHNNPLYRFGISPNKLMDYMMAEKPIVHSVSAGNDPVSEAGCGITVPPSDVTAIYNAIIKISDMPLKERYEMGKKGKKFVLAKHTYPVLAKKFLEVIEK
jgi:glycosyltransferase involved in cell wall biosynthesis